MNWSRYISPLLFGTLGFSVRGAKILTICVTVDPIITAQWIGVIYLASGELGFLRKARWVDPSLLKM